MKIIILFMIAYFFTVLACTSKPVKPAYKLGKYTLVQKYLQSAITGSIDFYSQNQFYTTIATTRHNYVYEKISTSQIKASCTDCNATYIFSVSNITENNEDWQTITNGIVLKWQLSK